MQPPSGELEKNVFQVGVAEDDIHLEVKDDILDLSAEGKKTKYSKEILLPSSVDAESMESSYKNGILEIELRKR